MYIRQVREAAERMMEDRLRAEKQAELDAQILEQTDALRRLKYAREQA